MADSFELFSNSVVNFGFGIVLIFLLLAGIFIIYKMFVAMQKQHIEHLLSITKAQNDVINKNTEVMAQIFDLLANHIICWQSKSFTKKRITKVGL